MLTRLETEIEERSTFINQIVGGAQDANRDLTDSETEMLQAAKKRIEECTGQLETVSETRSATQRALRRVDDVDREFQTIKSMTGKGGEVEYRSAGSWVVDMYSAHLGNREARERLEIFNRAAAHQRTDDNPGVVPDPIIGSVIDFIDASRPLVSTLGTSPVVSNLFYRPHVTQHTSVARQTDGTTTDVKEKVELASQKMLIERLQVEIETYGGYVNVSRQNIDFSSPQIFDIIVNDLAKEYAIVTEEVVADAIATTSATPIPYANDPSADELIGPFWAAVAAARAAVPTGGLFLAIAPDRLAAFGPLFAPYGVTNGQSPGFFASNFGNGPVGSISGVPVVMSTALDSGEAFVIATQTIELFEQRIGTLQVVEPSVLGVQVAYAGYFGTLIIDDDGIVPLEEST
jgi:HK97 family phage major capsid protein